MKNIIPFVKKYRYQVAIALILIVSLVVYLALKGGNGEETPEVEEARTVETINVDEYGEGIVGVAVPSASGNSFVVRSQASGRVDSVGIENGTHVNRGDLIAQLDNAAERAALVQAQGAYEAAQASGDISDVNITDANAALTAAKQGAISDIRSSVTSWNSVLFSTVDQLFASPRVGTPGVRIDADSHANYLNQERADMNEILNNWPKSVDSVSENSSNTEITRVLDQSITNTNRLITMVDVFIELLAKQKPDTGFDAAELATLQTEFTAARTTLTNSLAAIEGAKTDLVKAEEAVKSAEIGGTGRDISTANASIKQAQGSYLAAQAAYDKTLIRAPFNGIVSSVSVATGDIINVGADVAIIVPDEGVKTEGSFTLPLSAIKYTPAGAYVFTVAEDNTIHGVEVETGLVTNNSINVSGLSGNETIVKDVRGLKDGDEVTLN